MYEIYLAIVAFLVATIAMFTFSITDIRRIKYDKRRNT